MFYSLAAPVVKPSKEVPVAEGKTAQVSCSVDKANPLPLFTWEYKTKNCAKNCKWETVPGNLVLTPTNTPTNESVVRVEKDQPTTHYRCNASNAVGMDSDTVTLYRHGKQIIHVIVYVDAHTLYQLTCHSMQNSANLE